MPRAIKQITDDNVLIWKSNLLSKRDMEYIETTPIPKLTIPAPTVA